MTTKIDKRIEDLLEKALLFYDKAMEYEALADDRYREILEEAIDHHRMLAQKGNPVSKKLQARPSQLRTIADAISSEDPIWKGHVENNKFYTRKADLANGMAQTLLQFRQIKRTE